MKIKKWEIDVNHGSFFFCPYGNGPEPPIRKYGFAFEGKRVLIW